MQLTTIPLIILATVVAMGIVLYQYYYKQRRKGKLRLALSFLRFVALFGIFILLINPKLTKKEISIEKSNLILLVDDSSSMGESIDPSVLDSLIFRLENESKLQEKFFIEQYTFGSTLDYADSLTLKKPRTDITNALKSLGNIYSKGKDVVVLLSDGNNTYGEDYSMYRNNRDFTVYPVVIGDTTKYDDLSINQVNSNKYAFLNNDFPLEIFISYSGKEKIQSKVNILMNGERVHSQLINLDGENNAFTLSPNLKASTVGLKNISVEIDPLQKEKNTGNNKKYLTIEVIDEKTNIALVTEITHPDVGALKRAIESNEQRKVVVFNPNTNLKGFEDIDLFLLYQPTQSFSKVYEHIKSSNTNAFTITGPATDWDFLNEVQSFVSKENYNQTEAVSPVLNTGFSLFDTSENEMLRYPPLRTNLGETLLLGAHDILLNQKIRGTELSEPLFVLTWNETSRNAFLFGEDIWKWRGQNYREHLNFEVFDRLIGKIVLYLSTDSKRKRLELDYESLYEGVHNAKVRATYYDESYMFDPNAEIIVNLSNKENNESYDVPMLLKGGFYEVDLGNLEAGDYVFKVKVNNENISKSGSFRILEFDIEKRFVSSDAKKLDQLAEHTEGALFYPNMTQELIDVLAEDERFIPVQKSHENIVSLVDFRFLLAIIITALSIEWIIRKYNGLT